MYTYLWRYFFVASLPIKLIIILLGIGSLFTWFFIFQRLIALRLMYGAAKKFEEEFWSDIKLNELYEMLPETIAPDQLSAIFQAGFTEFYRLRNSGCQSLRVILEGVSRAMQVAQVHAQMQIDHHLHWIMIIASSSLYLGLLGTLFGIASALHALQEVGQINTLLLLAPGITDALTVSILSLLVALPALVFYYGYTGESEQLLHRYHIFQEEFIALLVRQTYEEQHDKPASH